MLTRNLARRIQRSTLIVFYILAISARAEGFFPDAIGSTWEYNQTGAEPRQFTVRLASRETVSGRDLLKLETQADAQLIQAQVVSATNRGLLLHARRSADEEIASFDPPRILLPASLKVGTQWELDDDVAGMTMHQVFKVIAEETVAVPAGEFRAYHLHCEQPWPLSISVDRWFAHGTGFIKDITTTRGPTGRLLSRVTTVLAKFAIVPPAPSPPPAPVPPATPAAAPKIKLEIAVERDGTPATTFRTDAPHLYVHWQGENLALNSVVRVAWVVDDVGDVAQPDFIIDQTETEISTPNSGARFTLSRPDDGWAPGKYRLELYVDDILMEKIAVSIKDKSP